MKISKRSTSAIVGSVLTLAIAAPVASSACMGDAFRFCRSEIPNVARIEACLMQNRSRLHLACQAEFQSPGNTRLQSEHFRQ